MKNTCTFWTLLLAFLSLPMIGWSQISFTNSNELLLNSNVHSGVAIAVVDMNGDGLDDIARLDEGTILNIEYQQVDGTFTNLEIGQIANGSQWSMCAADCDNNGFNDVLAGGFYDGVKLITANTDGTAFNTTTLPGADIFIQGSNFADINNDGFLDVFACHDDAESRIWGNNGNGTFFEADNWIDMATVPVSDNSGNYGSVWSDFDNDGDLDLYIAKCRQGVGNPEDPRRINALYVNDGNNNYTEMADEYGLKIGAQSWTAEFNDIDNDGDLDCFITNHDVASMLLENDGTGHFTDITAGSGLDVGGLPIQGLMRDFDNDGYLDILVAGSQHFLFRNNGDKTFSEVPNPFNSNDIESFGLGDLNHDGFIDIYAGYANIYTNPSNIDDVIWMNGGNDNNFLVVDLEGTISNRNAVGARVEVHGPWGMQVREIRAGESYGIMNSFAAHFGLGTNSVVDSLVIKWPSGVVNTYEDIMVNQFIEVIEEECISPTASITNSNGTVFCSGESTDLTAPSGYTYQWSNGENSQSITVTEAGTYNVTISDASGCEGVSANIQIEVDPALDVQLEVGGSLAFCEGGSVILTASEGASYQWSNGEMTQSIMAQDAGVYSVMVEGLCDFYPSEEVTVEVFSVEEPLVENDTIYEVSTATLEASGESPHWYAVPSGGVPLFVGPVFTTPELDATTTYYVEDLALFDGGMGAVGPTEQAGSSQYNGNTYNGGLYFDAADDFILQTVTVFTDTEATRTIELLDESGAVIASKNVLIAEGSSAVLLDFLVPEGQNYTLTTNGDMNQTTLGTNSPRLQRSNEDVEFPYVLENVVTITSSDAGDDFYYYFYNWQVEKVGVECTSDRVAVDVVYIEPNSVFGQHGADHWAVFPNPTTGEITIAWDQAQAGQLEVRRLDGALLRTIQIAEGTQQKTLSLAGMAKGLYTLVFQNKEGRSYQKVVVQ